MASESSALSGRMQPLLSFEVLLTDIFVRVGENGYQDVTNEQGIINLCTAYNGTVSEIVVDKLNQPELQKWDASMMPYTPDRSGTPRLRKAIADFLTRHFRAPKSLSPDKICLFNGVTSCLSAMAFVLCDIGDTILTAAPMYGNIQSDFLFEPGVKTYPVQMSCEPPLGSSKPYELTSQLLELAIREAKDKGHRVKALLLVNPVNPFGTIYSQEQIMDYLTFCKRHNLHCIIDEIYGCSVYDPSAKFTSVLSLDSDQLPDKNRTHVLWGTAKDFCTPGSPIGAVYTWNDEVIRGLKCLVDFHQIPHFIQISTAKLLEDQEWIDSVFFPTNLKRLDESSKITMATLDELGVAYLKPSAGLFIWADFRKYLSEVTRKSEMQLCNHFLDRGVAIPPSSAFYATQLGWFRIVFSVPRKQLIEAMRRLREACLSFSTQG